MQFEAKAVLSVGPVRSALSSKDELLPARYVMHRQTSGHARRRGRLKVQIRGLALARLCTLHLLVTDNGRAPLSSARHGEATLLYTEFRARNQAALEHIDVVVGHGRSGVPLSCTRLHQ